MARDSIHEKPWKEFPRSGSSDQSNFSEGVPRKEDAGSDGDAPGIEDCGADCGGVQERMSSPPASPCDPFPFPVAGACVRRVPVPRNEN